MLAFEHDDAGGNPARVSQRFLEFAKPVLDCLLAETRSPTEDQVHAVLKIAMTIWNAHVLERWGEAEGLIETTSQRMARYPVAQALRDVVQQLFERKANAFACDLQAIAGLSVQLGDAGQVRVRVEARTRSL